MKKKLNLGFFFRNGGGTYLCPARVFVNMKLFEELSDAELSRLWNAIKRNVNKIKITEKDIKVLSDFVYGIDRIVPAVNRALDEMDVDVNYLYEDYDPIRYRDLYYTFEETLVEEAVYEFIKLVKLTFY